MSNTIQILFSQPWIERLGWALVHFLWQGTLIAALYAIARRWPGQTRGAQFRYVLSCAALAALVAAPLVTLSLSGGSELVQASTQVAAFPLSPTASASLAPLSVPAIYVWRGDATPWLVAAWLAGAIIFWARLMRGWIVAARIRSMHVRPAPPEWQRTLDEIGTRIRLSSQVRLLESVLVQVPTVVGWLRPVVLMPVGALAGLPPEYVAALLAHELAHVRRHDYLVNNSY